MPRTARSLADDCICHVFNRGNCGMDIFAKDGDYAAFVKLLEEARSRYPTVGVLGYCLMRNHWHLVLKAAVAKDLSRFMGWLCTTHVRRWRAHRGSEGQGHLYQGRFKLFVAQGNEHLLTLLRFVEANPVRAKVVRQAEDWCWSSLTQTPGHDGVSIRLASWPVERPRNWLRLVNTPLSEEALARTAKGRRPPHRRCLGAKTLQRSPTTRAFGCLKLFENQLK